MGEELRGGKRRKSAPAGDRGSATRAPTWTPASAGVLTAAVVPNTAACADPVAAPSTAAFTLPSTPGSTHGLQQWPKWRLAVGRQGGSSVQTC